MLRSILFLQQFQTVKSGRAGARVQYPVCVGLHWHHSTVCPALGCVAEAYASHMYYSCFFAMMSASGMTAPSDIVISGCSAGGLAALLHVDKWAAWFPHARVVSMPDSGFFVSKDTMSQSEAEDARHNWKTKGFPPGTYQSSTQIVFHHQNASSGMDADCVMATKPDKRWQCFNAEFTSKYISSPVFVFQSAYDSWQLRVVRIAIVVCLQCIDQLMHKHSSFQINMHMLLRCQYGVARDLYE